MLEISIIAGLIPMLCWGVADFLQSTVVRKFGTYKTLFLGNLVSLLLLLPFFFIADLNIALSNFLVLVIGGLIAIISTYFFYESMKQGELSIVMPISASYPIVAITLYFLVLGTTISLFTFISISILLAGLFLVSTDFKKIKHVHLNKGVKEAVTTLFSWGFYYLVLEIASKNVVLIGISFPELSTMTLFFYSYFLLTIFLFVFSILKKGFLTKKDLKQKKYIYNAISVQVIYLVAWFVLNMGFVMGKSEIVTPISSLYPAISVLLALIFYKEKLVLNQKLGILIVLAGLFMISM